MDYPYNRTDEKVNRSGWGDLPVLMRKTRRSRQEGWTESMAESPGRSWTIVDQSGRNRSQEEGESITEDATKIKKPGTSAAEDQTRLPIDKIQLEASSAWSLTNSDYKSQPPAVEIRTVEA